MVKIKIDVVGGGLGGLSVAISLKETNKDISVSVHEKYKEIGYNHEGRRCGEAYTCEGEQARWKPIGKSSFYDDFIYDLWPTITFCPIAMPPSPLGTLL